MRPPRPKRPRSGLRNVISPMLFARFQILSRAGWTSAGVTETPN